MFEPILVVPLVLYDVTIPQCWLFMAVEVVIIFGGVGMTNKLLKVQ